MIEEIRRLLDEYVAWLRDKTALRQIGSDWVEITAPYLDRHNDCIQIYAARRDGGYLLTDDGNTLQDLQQSGCMIESAKRKTLLQMTLNGFGVQLSDGKLEVHASRDNFALRKHNLIQAILAVNDLFYLAVPVVASLFYEDVVEWLELHAIRYTPKVKFTGKSGYDHLFDFVVPKSRIQPERILRAITRPNRETAQAMVFAWMDTRGVRPPDSRAYAFLSDSEGPVPAAVLDALLSYEVKPVLWTQRERVREELAA